MRRGEIRLVDLEPVRGAEANKTRPAVIVSNDGANATAQRLGRGVVTVVPVTSSTERVYPFQVLLRAGDVLVQQGTNHAWSNRSDKPATIAFVLLDAAK